MMRALLLVLLVLIVLAFLYTGCMIARQADIIYLPRPYSSEETGALRARGGIALPFATSQGRQVAHYLPAAGVAAAAVPPRQIWLVFAGNGGRALDYWPVTPGLWPDDVGLLFVDYPGYGLCEGKPHPDTIRENYLEAVGELGRLWNLDITALRPRLRALGHSLGSAVALDAAARLGISRVVAVSPFTSMEDMAARMVGRPLTIFLRHRFDARASMRALENQGARVSILHGGRDRQIPSTMGRELAESHPAIADFTLIANGGHNDIFHTGAAAIGRAIRSSGVPEGETP